MYDDTDDEMEEMLSQGGGVSVASLTSPLEGPINSGPKSLPTALLRAPKLGSLPQDYRLQHLASLPPPLSLNGDLDLGTSAMDETEVTNVTNDTESYAPKPKFFSSYGSLREAHLTGRYAATNQAASTGQLLQNSQLKAEPPATLIPPQSPAPLSINAIPQKKQTPAQTMSIRDRMMQKAQQKKDEATKESDGGEQKMAASSLSAMMANEEKYDSTSIKVVDESATQPRRTSGLPAHVAKEAVAISYNSNLNLFAMTQDGQPPRRSSEQLHERQEEAPPMILSSSMTGLEVLRAASKAKPTEQRPTSLSILQGSSPPPSTMQHPPTFMQLSRTMSEPGPQTSASPQQQSQPPPQHTTLIFTQHDTIPPQALGAESAEMPRPNLVRLPDGRVLIPPQKFRSLNMSARSNLATQQQPAQSMQLPRESQHHSSWGMPASTTPVAGVNPLDDDGAFPSNRPEESNPDTQGAFDMDLE